jgi:hypothetical protein
MAREYSLTSRMGWKVTTRWIEFVGDDESRCSFSSDALDCVEVAFAVAIVDEVRELNMQLLVKDEP